MSLITSKFVQKVRFNVSDGLTTVSHEFEVSNMTFGYSEISESYTFVDDSKEKVVRGWRFVAGFDTPWLRRADSASDIQDVINNQNKDISFLILGIGMAAVPVVLNPVNDVIQVEKQRIKFTFDIAMEGKNKVSAIPSWFKHTRAKPGYLA